MQKHMYSELEFTDIFLTNPETTNTKSLQNVTSFFVFPAASALIRKRWDKDRHLHTRISTAFLSCRLMADRVRNVLACAHKTWPTICWRDSRFRTPCHEPWW